MRRFCVLPGALLIASLLTYGQTQPLSPNSGQSLTTSAAHLMTWDRLSAQFETALAAHEQTLAELSEKLKTSENSLTQSMLLLEKLSKQNEGLRNYNQQIGQRMYERDTDLVDAYDKINRLEKTALKLTVAAVCLAGALVVMIILAIRRFMF
jgi:septal ring factor EnvC (AmiA/AmiB activator)